MANTTVNKVVLGDETLLDLTGDTATAADVAEGKTFHLASGAAAVGTASGGGSGVSVFYGTCATAAATAAKAVVCEEFTSADLVEGTVVNVKFTYAQTYNGAPTLNVNSTGAKNVKRVGTTNAARYEWLAGEVLQFVYDGTCWMLTDGGIATTTYYGVTKLSSSTSSTSNALAATASAVKAAYDLANGKQDALVSGTNIKTVNGTSLLGSGNISTAELPTVTASDNGKVLQVVSGVWAAASSGSEAMTDAEVIASVEAVQVAHAVTVSGANAYSRFSSNTRITEATAGTIVRVHALFSIESITSVPTVTFNVTEYSGERTFVMPNEPITVTVTTSGSGGDN